jgi:uncharacterized membrane protein
MAPARATAKLPLSLPTLRPISKVARLALRLTAIRDPMTRTVLILPFAAAFVLASATGPAAADLKFCNATQSRVGVSIGYQDADGWATEGWWNIASQACETLLKGALPSRFIYIHAVDYDRGGEWAGSNFMCTADKTFAIRGVQECPKRGYKRTGFFEVDTGDAQEWTVRLTDPDENDDKEAQQK